MVETIGAAILIGVVVYMVVTIVLPIVFVLLMIAIGGIAEVVTAACTPLKAARQAAISRWRAEAAQQGVPWWKVR